MKEQINENKQYIIFNVGEEEYGIEITTAKEIVEKVKITPLPETEDFVLGLVNLRENIFPVIDTGKLLKIQHNTIKEQVQKIITIEHNDKIIGFVVDNIKGIKTVSTTNIKEPPNMIDSNPLIKSVYTDSDNELFIILDLLLVFDEIETEVEEGDLDV